MRLVPGGIYRLGLDLSAPEALHPAWLAGAVGVSLPGAEVVGIEQTAPDRALVTVRWGRKGAGEVDEGHAMVPLSEGLQLIPGASMPSASVSSIEKVREPMQTRAITFGPEPVEIWKLAAAFAMIGAAAYTAYRVKEKRRRA